MRACQVEIYRCAVCYILRMLVLGKFWEFCVWAYASREFTGKSRMRAHGSAGPNMEHQFDSGYVIEH